jgi:hypothetical protein
VAWRRAAAGGCGLTGHGQSAPCRAAPRRRTRVLSAFLAAALPSTIAGQAWGSHPFFPGRLVDRRVPTAKR